MKFEPVPLSKAKGKILGHNIAGANGQRSLRKGKPLTDEDLEKLRTLGRNSVYIAEIEPDDIDENLAARRVAEAVCGTGLHITSVSSGRANLLANEQGILRVDVERLAQINDRDGITLATLTAHSPFMLDKLLRRLRSFPMPCRNLLLEPQKPSQVAAIRSCASIHCHPTPWE